MLAPSQRGLSFGSHAPRGGGAATQAPTLVAPGADGQPSPAPPQSTRTSCPLMQPTAVLPSQRFALVVHDGPLVAQPAAPSEPTVHLRPNAAQSKDASLPFSHCSLCVPLAEHCGLSPSRMVAGHGPSVHRASPPDTMHCSPPRWQSRTASGCSCQQVMARPSTSHRPTTPDLPRPAHASVAAPRSAHCRSAAHELDCSPHSRIVSEKFTAAKDVISSAKCFTQSLKSDGTRFGGMGSLSHDVSSAHMCSTSSRSGGATSPRCACDTKVDSTPASLAAGPAPSATCSLEPGQASATTTPMPTPPAAASTRRIILASLCPRGRATGNSTDTAATFGLSRWWARR